ncbi:MAG: thioredoxin-like domain-containing protein [Bacteroidales bacterium]
MKRLLPILLSAITLLSSCDNGLFKNKFTITGDLSNYKGEYVYFTRENYKEGIIHDTAKVIFGKFKLKAKSESETPLYIFDDTHKLITTLLVKNGDNIKLKGEFSPYKLEISGNDVNTIIGEFYNNNAIILQKIDNLHSEFSTNYKDTTYTKNLHATTDSITTIATRFVHSHLESPASLFIIYKYVASHKDITLTRRLIKILSPEAKPVALAARIEKFAALQKYDKGKIMPYTLLHTEKDSSIFSFNKKNMLTIVTFWSISDTLSSKTLRQLRPIYEKYPTTKLQIHSISVDLDKTAWHQTIKQEAFPWSQSILPDGWNSQTIKSLNLTHIPSFFLLDRNGLIIARDIGTDSLNTLLKKTIAYNDSIENLSINTKKEKNKKRK